MFLLSVLHQKEVVQSVALFLLKWLKWITSKLRHFERILVTVYYSNILNYFTFLLSFQQKKVFHIFAISDALVDPIWHKLSYQHKIWSLRMRKKNKTAMFIVACFPVDAHCATIMPIPKFKNEVYTCQTSLTNLIVWLRFVTAPHFFFFINDFVINSKPLWKHVFN